MRGTREEARFALLLAGVLAPILLLTLIFSPAGQLNWLLETGPGLVGVVVLAATFRRFPMSHWVCVCVFLHILVLTYGGYYTYALTPLGNWARPPARRGEVGGARPRHLSAGIESGATGPSRGAPLRAEARWPVGDFCPVRRSEAL
ncbi:DUF2238 domain-containing protein [Pyxidicoccus parkwayensis]|uniref:DUF2238 domain-containing protein n=1 Tax=Pyxidicoccus parkwayensis TaxID=2813578 RepID=UPI001F514C95|nr:DUF2238 domain-containing protein [Pyxidicoccus parkwaysis]